MRLVSADFEYSSYHPWALEECKSISITNTLPRHIFFSICGMQLLLLLILMLLLELRSEMKTAAKVWAWKKAKFFAVVPKSAALQNWSHPARMTLSLSLSPFLCQDSDWSAAISPLPLHRSRSISVTCRHRQWEFGNCKGSSVQFWGVVS